MTEAQPNETTNINFESIKAIFEGKSFNGNNGYADKYIWNNLNLYYNKESSLLVIKNLNPSVLFRGFIDNITDLEFILNKIEK
jgi:hypothetical protein